MKRRLVFVTFFLISCNPARVAPVLSSLSDSGASYYPQTGHSIREPFLSYYQTHAGPDNFGYPITEALEHDGWTVQYFQFARLELHPENNPAYAVTVGWVGDLLQRRAPPLPERKASSGSLAGRYFPETGHAISGLFLTFFEANGDTVRFGRPIGQPFLLNGLLSQDFQSARLIWRPDLSAGGQVQLEPIGETYFLSSDLPLDLLAPVEAPYDALRHRPERLHAGQILGAVMRLEATARPGVWRVVVRLDGGEQPMASVKAILVVEGDLAINRRVFNLPPPRASGETHVLLDLSSANDLSRVRLGVFDQRQVRRLATLQLESQIATR